MPEHARLPLWRDKPVEQKLETLRQLLLDLYQYQLGAALADILRILDAHQPADAKESRDIQLMKELIKTNPNILNMNCEPGHITASALIVHPASQRALLHFHRRLRRWLQVGGHTNYETDVAQAALREAREETGLSDLSFFPPAKNPVPLDFDVHSIPSIGDQPEHLHLDFRYLLVTQQPAALAPAAGESTQFRWLSFAEALDLGETIDPSLHRLLRKVRDLLAQQGTSA